MTTQVKVELLHNAGFGATLVTKENGKRTSELKLEEKVPQNVTIWEGKTFEVLEEKDLSKHEFVQAIKEFNTVAGNTGTFDKRKASMYVGLVLEEVGEMIESFNLQHDIKWLEIQQFFEKFGKEFKQGDFDYVMDTVDRKEFLDAAVDIAVVSLGAGIAIGSDIVGAANEVMTTNLAKFPIIDGVRTALKDENGKVKKPEGWKAPDLSKFLLY